MRRTLLLLLVLLLVACNGRDMRARRSSAPTTTSLALVVDTNASEPVPIVGRLAAVVLESAGGGMSANILENEQEVLLADPDGRSSLVMLPRVPGNVPIRAVHLMLVPGSVQTRPDGGGGQVLETPASLAVPMPFVARLAAGRPWLVLRHRQRAAVATGPGGEPRWTPRLALLASDVHPLHDERAVIASVDPAALSAVALLPGWGRAAVTLRFAHAQRLLRAGAKLTPVQYAAALRPGDEIELVDALLRSIDTADVLAADDAPPHGVPPVAGGLSRARGVITQLFPLAGAFELTIRQVHVAAAGSPATAGAALRVLVDASTWLGWIPCAGAPPGAVAFEDLRIGMHVDVAWRDPAVQGRVRAERVSVRSLARGGIRIPLALPVRAVDPATNVVVLEPLSGAEIAWQGGTVATLVVALPPGALLLRREPPDLRSIVVGEIAPGDTLLVLAQPLGGNTARSTLAVATGP